MIPPNIAIRVTFTSLSRFYSQTTQKLLRGSVLNLIRNDSVISLIGPAILGGIFGLLAYLGVNPQPGCILLVLVFIGGGVIAVLAITYGLRCFLEPHRKNDVVD
jgi:hypothetical protein